MESNDGIASPLALFSSAIPTPLAETAVHPMPCNDGDWSIVRTAKWSRRPWDNVPPLLSSSLSPAPPNPSQPLVPFKGLHHRNRRVRPSRLLKDRPNACSKRWTASNVVGDGIGERDVHNVPLQERRGQRLPTAVVNCRQKMSPHAATKTDRRPFLSTTYRAKKDEEAAWQGSSAWQARPYPYRFLTSHPSQRWVLSSPPVAWHLTDVLSVVRLANLMRVLASDTIQDSHVWKRRLAGKSGCATTLTRRQRDVQADGCAAEE